MRLVRKRTNATGSQAMMDCEVRYVGTGRNACATGRRTEAQGSSAGDLFAAEEEDYVEEDEDGYDYF